MKKENDSNKAMRVEAKIKQRELDVQMSKAYIDMVNA